MKVNLIICLASYLLVTASRICSAGILQWKPYHRPVNYRALSVENPLQVTVKLKGNSCQVDTVFTYKARWLSCDSGVSLNYNLSVYNAELGLLRAKPVRIQNCDSPFELTLNDLRRNKPYHVYLSVKSDDNTYSFKSKEVYFTTTAVQSAYIIKGNQHVQIVCLLSTGSTATRGCKVNVQFRSTQTNVGVETQLFDVHRSQSMAMVAQRCIRLPRTLAVSNVEVFDWTEDGDMGTVAVPSTIIESLYTPCFVESDSSKAWKEMSHVILFILSATFVVLGMAIISIGMICRLCRVHRFHSNELYKPIKDCSRNSRRRIKNCSIQKFV